MAHDAAASLAKAGLVAERTLCGPFMTSLEMQGASLSVLPLDLDQDTRSRLDAPASAPAWARPATSDPAAATAAAPYYPAVAAPREASPAPSLGATGGAEDDPPLFPLVFGRAAAYAVDKACVALAVAEHDLTAWDQVAGDGDCGLTVARGAKAVASLLNHQYDGAGHFAERRASAAYGELADAVSRSMGGTSGALVEVGLRAAQLHVQREEAAGRTAGRFIGPFCTADHAGAFAAGVRAVGEVGGAGPGMRTMLDALLPAVDALQAASAAAAQSEAAEGPSPWTAAAAAAEAGAEATRGMGALAGRSNYVNAELLATVPDPGAKAVAIAMTAAVATVPIPSPSPWPPPQTSL